MILSDNGISKVYREGDWVFKQQPKFMTDNEIWYLQTLYSSGYVPYAEQIEIELIKLEYIESQPVTDCQLFRYLMGQVLRTLKDNSLKHGDATEKNILVRNNRPYLIDFSESRLACDPRPEKRPEGDDFWFGKTTEKLCSMST